MRKLALLVLALVLAGCGGGGGGGSSSPGVSSGGDPGPGDSQAPSTPAGFGAVAVSSSEIDLAWTPSVDNAGVAGYKVYRNGTFLKNTTSVSTSDTGLQSSTQYCYTVSALDSAGNESAQSSQACATTFSLNAGGNDAFLIVVDSSGNTKKTLQWGTAADDIVTGVDTDSAGNAYVVGYTSGTLGAANIGFNDAFLTKVDSSGNLKQSVQWGTNTDDFTNRVTVSGGFAYIAGTTFGSLGGTLVGSTDAFLTKLNLGTLGVEWNAQLGSPGIDSGIDTAVDGIGNIYLAGTAGFGSFDGGTNIQDQDMFLAKFSSNGQKLSVNRLGSPALDNGASVALNPQGNPFLAGYVSGTLPGQTQFGGYDVGIFKPDLSWKEFGSSGDDYVSRIKVDGNGNVFIVGYTNGNLSGSGNLGGYDVYLTKMDPSGTILWSIQWGTGSDDFGFDVDLDSSGNAYVVGSTKGNVGANNAGGRDAFLTFVNSSGAITKSIQWGTAADDEARGVVLDPSGNVLVSGITKGDISH